MTSTASTSRAAAERKTGPLAPHPSCKRIGGDACLLSAGEIPRDLDGIYLRNTENPVHLPIERYHPFDGDEYTQPRSDTDITSRSTVGSASPIWPGA